MSSFSSLDDCQALVKAMFNDFEFRDAMRLGAINSINWTRVLAQTVYFATAALALGGGLRRVDFSVPTGNFGDIFAGYVAKRMGFPIGQLIVATNENDILHRTLQSGDHTLRRMTLGQGQMERLRTDFASARADQVETRLMMSSIRARADMIVDPHTAVGLVAAEQHLGENPMVTLATAHPAKFPQAVSQVFGESAPLPAHMADLYERDERMTVLPNDLGAVQSFVREQVRAG